MADPERDFTAPDVHARRRGKLRGVAMTFEFGHPGTRTGIVLQVTGTESGKLARMVGELAMEAAGEQSAPCVTDPGWWAIIFGWAANAVGAPSIQRVAMRAERHAVVAVEPGSMATYRPTWPLVRLSPTGPWLDLRGELALRHGPSDGELRAYARQARLEGEDAHLQTLARAFDMGIIEWGPRDPLTGRMSLRGTGSH